MTVLLLSLVFCASNVLRGHTAALEKTLCAAAWRKHVQKFHYADESILAHTERYRAFCESFDFVNAHNAKYEAGEATFWVELNYRAAFLPDEKLKGTLTPAGRAAANAAAAKRQWEEYHQQRRRLPSGPTCGPGLPFCITGTCCNNGTCGTGPVFCGKGCNITYGHCNPARERGTAFPSPGYRARPFRSSPVFQRYASKKLQAGSWVDWRTVANVVNPVKDQGGCGSCWAFAATAAIESINGIVTGTLPNLSEQQMMACSTNGGGCGGGWPPSGMQWVIDNGGQATECAYPYTATDQACQSTDNSGGKATGVGYVTSYSDSALMAALSIQPVVLIISASSNVFQGYAGGILNDAAGCGTSLDHAVVAVGYATDPSSGLAYYIIRNSWGAWWGENGYVRVAMTGDGTPGMCGILQSEPEYPLYQSSSNPCGASPCGDGSCVEDSGSTGGYYCDSCPSGFVVATNPDGTQTCAADPCSAGTNPCGAGNCNTDSSQPYGYSCDCPSGTVPGQSSDQSPTCVACGGGGRIYVLQSGDSCSGIASHYHLSGTAFLDLNPGINCYTLFEGQTVNVGSYCPNPGCTSFDTVSDPGSGTCNNDVNYNYLADDVFKALNPDIRCDNLWAQVGWEYCTDGAPMSARLQSKACGQTYVMTKNDTCASVALKFGLSPPLFAMLNPGVNCKRLATRQQVCVRPLTSGVPCRKKWVIQAGNSCVRISTYFGLNQTTFAALNPGIICSKLTVGTVVCVDS